MGGVVIDVKGLSKKFLISHENKARYSSLRDEWADNFKRILKGNRHTPVKEREEFWALKDVNFQVSQGDRVGIIGRNGAGKSTLLKILSRIMIPTSGRLEIEGRVASLLEVGTGFHPELTGRENIFLNGAILGMGRGEIKRKFDEIVAFAEVKQFLDTPVKRYSSGMYVRLAFAVAAHLEPEILVVDEVLAVGDADFQKKCLGKMEDVSESGRTVLFVSHNLEAVRSLCQRAILLNKGEVQADGPAQTVITTYLSNQKKNSSARHFSTGDAPGTEVIKILQAEARFSEDTALVTIESEVKLKFKFVTYNDIDEFNLSLFLWTISGVCIFNVGTPQVNLKAGTHESELVIPGNFLNDDYYTVELLFVSKSSIILFKIEDLVMFELHDVPRIGNWYGKWQGAVRPKLSFTIE